MEERLLDLAGTMVVIALVLRQQERLLPQVLEMIREGKARDHDRLQAVIVMATRMIDIIARDNGGQEDRTT